VPSALDLGLCPRFRGWKGALTLVTNKVQGVCHTVALPIYIKRYLKAKEE
jgi:hypothetical protein